MASLMDKLKAASTIKETAILDESKFFTEKDFLLPMILPLTSRFQVNLMAVLLLV